MGGVDSKAMFKEAVQDLANKEQLVMGQDDAYWERFWSATGLSSSDLFELILPEDVRTLRDKASGNLTTLCFKLVQRLSQATSTGCSDVNDRTIVLNCVRLLTRILPFLFEHAEWRDLFWSPITVSENEEVPSLTLAQTLLSAITDLLFCPDFTVVAKKSAGREQPVDLSVVDSCEYIWEAGVGCAVAPPSNWQMDSNRTDLLQLLVTCCSESLYRPPQGSLSGNKWLDHLVSVGNRHVLPMLVSLMNTVCAYNPSSGIPYYHTLVFDYRERLVEVSAHLLMILLDYSPPPAQPGAMPTIAPPTALSAAPPTQEDTSLSLAGQQTANENLFKLYISRLHQKEDLQFITKGISVLLSNPIKHSYLPMSSKKISFTQEVLVLLWKMVDLNKKFLAYMLQSSLLFDIIVPTLYEMLSAKTAPNKVGLLHVGVFILLVMSGERNFGVRLNKPYNHKLQLDLPSFNGNHADLLLLVLHRIIISGLPRLQPLYDCLLTIVANVSPYVKSLSMLTCTRLIHLLESFSTPWFLCARPNNHFLVFYLLETFNNLVQYQFDGNTNLVYSIIRSKAVFYQLASLTEETCRIPKSPTLPSAAMPIHSLNQHHHDTSVTSSAASLEQPQQHAVEVHEDTTGKESDTVVLPDITDNGGPGMPEITTPNISLEVTESSGNLPDNDDAVATDEHNEPNSKQDETTEVGEEVPIPKPEDRSAAENSIPELQSLSISTAEAPDVTNNPLPKLAAVRPKPTPAPRAYRPMPFSQSPVGGHGHVIQRSSVKDKLLPLREKLADNASKLQEYSTEGGFVPTAEWLNNWKSKLPLDTLMKLLQILVPQVDKMCKDNEVSSEQAILDYLKNGTLVGLLPVPHPIIVRSYRQNISTDLWFHTYIWGVIFVRSTSPPIWMDTKLQLFQVQIID
ncbi:protein HID1-like isoform X2 [Dysidea avara]|uniref:protein HID1-like isoform X2 n=1 Tax=Dysidea avara TaxID=196820 RepID=UPI0033346A8B